jgi:oxalate decarboxylase/phosphoglucose isomerase-like protein (cupin superfamily)
MSVNTGDEPLRLLYFFAADSFDEIVYKFPGL